MVTHRSPLYFSRKNNLCKISGLIALIILSLEVSESFAMTEITIDTNKGSYGPGDLIELHGQVKNSPNQLVALEVKDPSGNTIMIRTVQTDANGNFVLKFKLPSTEKSGTYSIITNTKVNGDTIKETKTIAVANIVPEFPLNTGIIMTIVLAMGIAITKFKNLSLQ
jgi:hypothetical protein